MISYLQTDKIQEWTLNGLSTSINLSDWSDLVCPLMMINEHQNHKLGIYIERTAIGCFALCRNLTLHGTPPSITLSWDGPRRSIWERQEDILDMMTICISHRGEFLLLFLIQIALQFISLSYWQFICKYQLRYLTAGYYPHLFLCNKAVPFQPHADFTPVHPNDSRPCQFSLSSISSQLYMYVTVIQNISASTWSVSSLCDSLKHLNLHQINLFLSQNLLITCYSTLYEKQTLFICIYL